LIELPNAGVKEVIEADYCGRINRSIVVMVSLLEFSAGMVSNFEVFVFENLGRIRLPRGLVVGSKELSEVPP
jgi:hypothetical protein